MHLPPEAPAALPMYAATKLRDDRILDFWDLLRPALSAHPDAHRLASIYRAGVVSLQSFGWRWCDRTGHTAPMILDAHHDGLLAPLFAVLPLEAALGELLPAGPACREAVEAVRALVGSAELRGNGAAQAALWLYVDALDESHTISQTLHDTTGSFLHGIMHRREGDFGNSHYWIRRTGRHPVWREIAGYDPDAFIDAVAAARGKNPPKLVAMQRAEWVAVMRHCLVGA